MPFQPGQSANPNGRTPGTRNKRDAEIWARLEARGDLDPADFLSSVVTNKSESSELRTQAANMLMPYKYGKRGAIPPPRYVMDSIEVPAFSNVEDAEAYLASLPVLLGQGEIDSQTAIELSTLIRNWIISKNDHTELELKVAAHAGLGDTRITIRGGLPPLPREPGSEQMILPVLNGHDFDSHALASPTESTPTDSTPQQEPSNGD